MRTTRRRRRRSAARRSNTTVRRRRRRAARRNPRRVVRRRKARRSNVRRAAPKRRRRRRAANRRAAPRKRRRARRANPRRTVRRKRRNARRRVRRAAPRRRRNRRRTVRRSAPKRRRNRRRVTRRAAPRRRRRNARTARRYNRRAAPRRRRSARRRRNYGFSLATPIRTRGYIGGRRRNRRRRNPGSMVGGIFGSAKSTLRGAPAVLAKGVNAGAGYLLTSLLAGGVESVAGGRLGRFNGIASALVGMLIARILPDKYVSKIPYASKGDMMIGVGLYGVVQLVGLLLPESWRARLGLSGMGEYMTGAMGGFGDYIGLPGNGMRQTVGGLGYLSEYVAMGNPNAAAQAQSDVAAAQSMAASNPISVADAMLDQSEFQEATFNGMGEYLQTGGAIGAGAGGLGAFWAGQGQYGTYANPDPSFRGFGIAQMPAGQAFAQMPGQPVPPPMAVPTVGMPAMAPPPVAATPFSPTLPDACGPCYPGQGCDPVTGQPMGVMGPCGDQLFNGCMPNTQNLCPTAPVGACGPGIEAGGLFMQPWQNLV